MKYYIFAIFLTIGLLFCGDVHAKKHIEDDFERNRIVFNGWITYDTYSGEVGYHYMLSNYIGVGGTLGYWRTFLSGGRASGKGWWVDEEDNDPSSLCLRPSVIIKSPKLNIFSLYAEPGIMMSIPYQKVDVELIDHFPNNEYKRVSTNKGQWLALDLRLGISADFDSFGITIGYLMSNLDTFSMFRHMSYDGVSFKNFYDKTSFRQGAFISASFAF
ncbi:MAG: hypothetical protein K2J42_02395 [Muribaculaceae bacterium]|nr:hypothetical protein [Muribaculaceae bacterium]